MGTKLYPPIVGFTGKAGAGKDTLAAYMVRQHGYARYSLADPIKDLLNARFMWKPEDWEDRNWKEQDDILHGGFSPRSWAQWLGTEVGRHLAGDDVWVNALLAKAAGDGVRRLVIPDVRFNNEAKKIQDMGGIVIETWREGAGTIAHVSERGVDDLYVDYSIDNNGTIEEAEEWLQVILDGWARDFGHDRA